MNEEEVITMEWSLSLKHFICWIKTRHRNLHTKRNVKEEDSPNGKAVIRTIHVSNICKGCRKQTWTWSNTQIRPKTRVQEAAPEAHGKPGTSNPPDQPQ